MKLLLLLLYLLGAAGTKILKPQQVELIPDENLQRQMKVRPGLQVNPAGPVDRAKGAPKLKAEEVPSRRLAPDREPKR
jgi:hypothetical protein